MDKYYLTKERLEELKQELQYLKTKRRLEVAEHLKRAKEYGDLSENAEYAEAKEEQRQVETRIYELEDLLKRAVIIKKKEGSDVVGVGSKVTIRRDDKYIEYTIVGVNEADPPRGKISNESPLGRALLGRKVGESVTVITPAGEVVYHITKIT
jgi:transcription elongation factor GreA